MADVYTTKEGDTVDLIAFRERGQTADVTEAILALNAGLADLGAILPMGVKVTLPDAVVKKVVLDVPRIWS
jgi:phage tail protein X